VKRGKRAETTVYLEPVARQGGVTLLSDRRAATDTPGVLCHAIAEPLASAADHARAFTEDKVRSGPFDRSGPFESSRSMIFRTRLVLAMKGAAQLIGRPWNLV
jgi:hypothetical protein